MNRTDLEENDKKLVPIFRNEPQKNAAETLKQGRPIYDDQEVVEVHVAGRKDYPVFPVTAYCMWERDETGEYRGISYAERWPKQYQQFKSKDQQTKSGTPLEHLPFLTPARRAELRALHIYTAEALASVDGLELKNLGANGRELKNQAATYIEHARNNAVPEQVRAELEALRAQNDVLANDVKMLRDRVPVQSTATEDRLPVDLNKLDNNFDGMDDDTLMAFIKAKTGVEPRGRPNHRILVGMAETASKAAP